MNVRAIRMLSVLGSLNLITLALGGPLDPPSAPASTTGPEPRSAIGEANTPGDSDSVYRIDAPGSYYLTGNIAGEPGKCGIEIAASDVTLDLMGFALIGVSGSLSGITVPSAATNITIRNGTVESWAEHGVDAGEADNSELLDLRASENGTPLMDHDGLRLGEGGVIANCVARGHPAEGISADSGTVVMGCAASENSIGILGSDITVTGCSATGNTFGGMSVGFGTVSDCTSSLNDGYGFRIDRGTVSGCTASRNGGNGIWVNGESLITGNICTEQFSGAGIFAGSGPATARIDGNLVAGNDIGIQALTSGNLIIRNTAHGNTTSNFSINTGNAYGPIVNVAGVGDITTLVATEQSHPWANFEY